jgi:ABC-type dipeptide/oligopeptide/nickel transport system permease subunit
MSTHNHPLTLGLLISLIFLIVAIFGPTLAPKDPLAELQYWLDEAGNRVVAPFRPGQVPGFPLGTDRLGRDVVSRILWGVRPTLILSLSVVAARLLIGLFLGVIAGWNRGFVERIVDQLIGASIGIPLLVFSIALIFLIGIERGLISFLIALSFTGWADIASLTKNQTIHVVHKPSIEGAYAIGMKPGQILWRYVLPQLGPILPAIVAFELAAVTLLIVELGFLGVFIGGGTATLVTDGGGFSLEAGMPELGQMLSDFWAQIIQTPWMPLVVGTLVFIEIFAFNMLGEGLRRHVDVTRTKRSRHKV